jgi:hypothetical protein
MSEKGIKEHIKKMHHPDCWDLKLITDNPPIDFNNLPLLLNDGEETWAGTHREIHLRWPCATYSHWWYVRENHHHG